MNEPEKKRIKQAIIDAIKDEADINKIIIFGSFPQAEDPNDIDLAVLGQFKNGYLETAIRLKKRLRHISRILPVDVVPIMEDAEHNRFVKYILDGETIYER